MSLAFTSSSVPFIRSKRLSYLSAKSFGVPVAGGVAGVSTGASVSGVTGAGVSGWFGTVRSVGVGAAGGVATGVSTGVGAGVGSALSSSGKELTKSSSFSAFVGIGFTSGSGIGVLHDEVTHLA